MTQTEVADATTATVIVTTEKMIYITYVHMSFAV